MKVKTYVYIFIALVVIYLGLNIILPTDPTTLKKYNLTQTKAHFIALTIAVPLALIWLSALYSFVRFKTYAELVKRSKEGKPLNQLADGLMVLAFSLPLTSIVSSLLNYMVIYSPNIRPTATIARNYLTLIFQLIAFITIAKGADGLLGTLRPKLIRIFPRHSAFVLITTSSLFTWLIAARPLGGDSGTIYYLPNWLIVTTLTVPYLFIWYKGALAAYRLYVYKNKVTGYVYKHLLSYFVSGMAVIITLSILLRLLVTLSERINRLDFTPLLLIIYLILILYTVGFGLVARGARQLKKIEEV